LTLVFAKSFKLNPDDKNGLQLLNVSAQMAQQFHRLLSLKAKT